LIFLIPFLDCCSSSFSIDLFWISSIQESRVGTGSSYCTKDKIYYHSFLRNWTFSGTASRTVTAWIPDIVWYNDYTGYYSGTIYKDVWQPYTDTFNPTSQKYVVYISDSTVSALSDLNMVMGYAETAELFLVGTSGI